MNATLNRLDALTVGTRWHATDDCGLPCLAAPGGLTLTFQAGVGWLPYAHETARAVSAEELEHAVRIMRAYERGTR